LDELEQDEKKELGKRLLFSYQLFSFITIPRSAPYGIGTL